MVKPGIVQMDATPGQCSASIYIYHHLFRILPITTRFAFNLLIISLPNIYSSCSDGVVFTTLAACGKDPCQVTQTDCSLIHAQLSPYPQTPVWEDQSLVLAWHTFPGTSTTPRVSSASCSSMEGAKGTRTTLRP